MFSQGLIGKLVKIQRFVGSAVSGNNPKGTTKKSFVSSKLNAVSTNVRDSPTLK